MSNRITIAWRLYLVLLAALPGTAFASTFGEAGNGNLTIALFPDSEGDTCKANDISKAISLTTSYVPVSYTCFNVSDIFSQHNSTGFQNATGNTYTVGNHTIIQPNGVAWLLENLDQYDPKANYSHVWYAQGNESEVEEGRDAPWVFYTYAFPNCRQVGYGDVSERNDHPWFETSCQTAKSGACRTNPDPIVSFAINTAKRYNHDGCQVWAKQGAAAPVGEDGRQLVIRAAAVAAAVVVTLQFS